MQAIHRYFNGGRITPDAGGLSLRELDQRYLLTDKIAQCLHDPHDASTVRHDLLTLARQRLFSFAQGYDDNYDAATLARAPALKITTAKASESAVDLASPLTLLSRFENMVIARDLRRFSDWLLDFYLILLCHKIATKGSKLCLCWCMTNAPLPNIEA